MMMISRRKKGWCLAENSLQRTGAALGMEVLIIAFFLLCLTRCPASAGDLVSALEIKRPVMLCGETIPLDDAQVRERFEKQMLLSLGNRPQLILWLKRSTRYFPFIEKSLRQNKLPEDLKFLAVAESALRMHAGSIKGAMGVWQLMPQTARKYGLLVNDAFDERRNIYLSTPAALAYLKDLYEQFGSWSLSLAAYNLGEERIEAEILEQGVDDYYRLYLPLETQRFVLRIMAIKLIFQAPDHYGVNLPAAHRYPPDVFSTVRVSIANDIPLRLIAEAAKTDFKTIKDLNPELRGYYLAAGKRMVNVPRKSDAGFQQRLAVLVERDGALRDQRLYIVKKGDSLSGIAQKFDVPIMALLIWNRIGLGHVIHPGQRLVVYSPTPSQVREPHTNDGDGEG